MFSLLIRSWSRWVGTRIKPCSIVLQSHSSSNFVFSLLKTFDADRSLPSESREICGLTLKFGTLGCNGDLRELLRPVDDEVDVLRIGVSGSWLRRLFLLLCCDVVDDDDVDAFVLTRGELVVRGELIGEVYLVSFPVCCCCCCCCCRDNSFLRVCGVLPGPPDCAGVVSVDTGPLLRVWLFCTVDDDDDDDVRVDVGADRADDVDMIDFGVVVGMFWAELRIGEYSVFVDEDEIRVVLFELVVCVVLLDVRSASPPSELLVKGWCLPLILLQLLPHCQTLNQPNTHDIGYEGFEFHYQLNSFCLIKRKGLHALRTLFIKDSRLISQQFLCSSCFS